MNKSVNHEVHDVHPERRGYGYTSERAGANISWSSIFAGVVTFFAVFITLSFISSAIGFGMLTPTSDNPFAGIGTSLTVWTVVALIISFLCAGFVGGLTSQRMGMVHGFLTWATSIVMIFILVIYTTVASVSTIGSGVASVGSAVGSAAGQAASGVGLFISDNAGKLVGNVDINTDEVQKNIKEILIDTDEETLQPEYIQNQMNAASEDVQAAAKEVALHPENADEIANQLIESLKERSQTIGQGVDKEAVAAAVAKNTDLTEEEAKQATDNIYEGIQNASKEAEEALDRAAVQIEEAKASVQEGVEDARETAEDVSNTTAKASIWTFVALVVSAVITAYAGVFGSRLGQKRYVKREY